LNPVVSAPAATASLLATLTRPLSWSRANSRHAATSCSNAWKGLVDDGSTSTVGPFGALAQALNSTQAPAAAKKSRFMCMKLLLIRAAAVTGAAQRRERPARARHMSRPTGSNLPDLRSNTSHQPRLALHRSGTDKSVRDRSTSRRRRSTTIQAGHHANHAPTGHLSTFRAQQVKNAQNRAHEN